VSACHQSNISIWLNPAVVEMQSIAAEAAMLAAFVQLLRFYM
jgi:hypothetical protein